MRPCLSEVVLCHVMTLLMLLLLEFSLMCQPLLIRLCCLDSKFLAFSFLACILDSLLSFFDGRGDKLFNLGNLRLLEILALYLE